MNKIVLDCERMKYADTGIYHYCLNLGNHLAGELDTRKEKLVFYAPESAQEALGRSNTFITQHSLHKFLMPTLGSYDLWHSTYQMTSYLPERNRRIKVLLTIHDLNFIYDDKKTEVKKSKHLKHLQANVDRSDAIICISEFCKKDLLKYCDTGNRPIYIIHNGTNLLNNPGLSSHSYKPSNRFLFSIGVITRKKNFHSLLPLLQQDDDMELLIAGREDDTEYLNYLMDTARDLGVDHKLRILGSISENEKAWYFENCYAFTSPSTAEGFCMPVAEAMSVGKPLFLSNKTALPEIGGNVAFYFSDFKPSQMQQTFTNGMTLYKETNMKDAIKKRGADFCWEKAAREYLDVYRSLL
ncbi:MAG: glycosyltransferase family 4 protein [Bacteroidetes bacterium]|nr:glycosyltransferase family 4 protein [Bacteroidota bacterium]